MNNVKKSKTPNKSKVSLSFGDVSPDYVVQVPYYKEPIVRNDDVYVPYGEANLFPNELLELIQQSVTATSILNGTMEMIKNYEITLNAKLPSYPYVNNDKDSVIDLVTACAYDYLVFGQFAIQVIWNRLNKISEIIHIPSEMIRMNTNRDKIYFNRFWSKFSSNNIIYNSFNPAQRKADEFSQVYVYTNGGHRQTYGLSPFSGCLNDIATEVSASYYVKNSMDSGLASRFIINLPNSANLTDDEKESIEESIRDKFCGSKNAGAFMLYFNNNDSELNVSKIDTDDSHERFKTIMEFTQSRIFICLHTTPNLFGSPNQTTGFNTQEYQDAYNLYYKMTLAPTLNSVSQALNDIFGMDDALTIVTESAKQDDMVNEDDSKQDDITTAQKETIDE